MGCLSPAKTFFSIEKKRKSKKLSTVDCGENKVNSSVLLSEPIEAGSETLDSQSKHFLLVLFSGSSVFLCCAKPFSCPCSKSQDLAICISIQRLWLWMVVGLGGGGICLDFFFPPVLVLWEGRLGGGEGRE